MLFIRGTNFVSVRATSISVAMATIPRRRSLRLSAQAQAPEPSENDATVGNEKFIPQKRKTVCTHRPAAIACTRLHFIL